MPATELQQLADRHMNIIRMALNRSTFRHQMPEGGPDAIDAGLVVEADPTWMYSDSYGSANRFSLTDLGKQAAHARGLTCQCRGCAVSAERSGRIPANALEDYCFNCQASIKVFGLDQYEDLPSCGMHAKYLRDQDNRRWVPSLP